MYSTYLGLSSATIRASRPQVSELLRSESMNVLSGTMQSLTVSSFANCYHFARRTHVLLGHSTLRSGL